VLAKKKPNLTQMQNST